MEKKKINEGKGLVYLKYENKFVRCVIFKNAFAASWRKMFRIHTHTYIRKIVPFPNGHRIGRIHNSKKIVSDDLW